MKLKNGRKNDRITVYRERAIECRRAGHALKETYRTFQVACPMGFGGMGPVILPKKDRKEQRGYDKYLYKLRHLAENCFLLLKRWSGIAIRYAKTSDTSIAAVHIRCSAIWAAIRV